METNETTTKRWPKRIRRPEVINYLKEEHGIPLSEKTLRNRHCLGTGPRGEYFGSWWFTTPEWVDEWVASEMGDLPANRREAA